MRISTQPLGAVHELFAPTRCLACRRRGRRLPWCAVCDASVRVPRSQCLRCAAPSGRAHACWPPGAPVEVTVVAYDYAGVVAAALRTAKLDGVSHVWDAFAAPLSVRVRAADLDPDVVTWVPTPRARVRARGADHARLLACRLARRLELPCHRLLEVDTRGASTRYEVHGRLPATSVLLVDDLVTTGRTVWRCSTALRRAGAGSVAVAAVARAGVHALGAGTDGR